MKTVWISLAWAVLLFSPATPKEAQAGQTVAPLVLYGPDGPSEALEARALAAFNLQAAHRRAVPQIHHVAAALKDIPAVELVGDAEFLHCPGTTLDMGAFRQDLDRALQHILYVEVDEAILLLDRLGALVPCAAEVLPREELARISYLQGVGLSYVGELDEARERYRRALVVYPNLSWDSRFPPGLEEVFTDAIHEALKSRSVTILVEPMVGGSADLWVDGQEMPTVGGVLSLAEGLHLLQWQLDSGEFVTRAAMLAQGDSLTLISRDDVAEAALTGQGREVTVEMATDAMRRFVESSNGQQLYLADLRDVDLLHRFGAEEGVWSLSDPGAVALRQRKRRLATAGSVSLIAGCAMMAIGATMGAVGYHEAHDLLDDMPMIQSQDEADLKSSRYFTNRGVAYAGYTLVGIGGASVAVGIPLTVAGAREGKRAPGEAARLMISPMSLTVTGQF